MGSTNDESLSMAPEASEAQSDYMKDEVIVLAPYPHLSTRQVKRLQARAAQTMYVHDWPFLFALIIRKEWSALRRVHKFPRGVIPTPFFKATQLYL